LSGCLTSQFKGETWPFPPAPNLKEVSIVPIKEVDNYDEGFYLSNKDAVNLTDNIDEIKAYTEKIEALINKMKDYYNAK